MPLRKCFRTSCASFRIGEGRQRDIGAIGFTNRYRMPPGQRFLGWTHSATGTNNPLAVTMDQSKFITANFTKRPRLMPMLCGGVPNGEVFQLLLTGDFGERYLFSP